jgi:hypothetical protein
MAAAPLKELARAQTMAALRPLHAQTQAVSFLASESLIIATYLNLILKYKMTDDKIKVMPFASITGRDWMYTP